MQRKLLFVTLVVCLVVLAGVLAVSAQGPSPRRPAAALGTAFAYQGQLTQSGAPVNGSRQLSFRLYDAPSAGNLLGSTTQTLTLTHGLFTTALDFGSLFDGNERYLGITIGGDPELAPRQRLSAVPYALHAADAWSINGNGGTNSGNMLGTMDNQTLTLAISGTAALRLVPGSLGPNLIGGSQVNTITLGISGATIGGGGYPCPGCGNGVSADYGTVGGGYINLANGDSSTVGGGNANNASGYDSTIGGGVSNIAGNVATVAGGDLNRAYGYISAIGGGYDNQVDGSYATVPGGRSNYAKGSYGFAAGYRAKALHNGAFVWGDSNSFDFNSGGDNHFDVRATGGISLVTNIDGSGNPTAANVSIAAGNASFGAQTRQMLNLWFAEYGIGVQSGTEYFRSNSDFAWFQHGVHSDTQDDPGSGGTRVMRIDGSGNLHVLGSVNSGGADVAERVATSDTPQPGDVVEIDPEHEGQFRLASHANSTAVAGVVSTQPGLKLNSNEAKPDETGVALALAGRVPVKASAENGAIRPGDLLVASDTAGHAMRAGANPAPGTIVGKALGSLGDGVGTIEMLVMLR